MCKSTVLSQSLKDCVSRRSASSMTCVSPLHRQPDKLRDEQEAACKKSEVLEREVSSGGKVVY